MLTRKKLLVARSLGVGSTNSLVLIKILNPISESVRLHMSKPLESDKILGSASKKIHLTLLVRNVNVPM